MHSRMILLAQALPEGRVFGLDMQTLISIGIQLLNGVILAVALFVILYKPVKEFMQKRTQRIQGNIDEADETMVKAKELIAEYNTKIKDIEKERIEILEATRLKVADESKKTLEKAKQEANEIRKRSMDSVLAEKNRLEEESRLYIIELASLMAQKYITQTIDNENQDRIYEETLAQLEETQWQI